jgi:hypothetical protein
MSKEQKEKESGAIVFLEPGVELLHAVSTENDKVRVVIYRDSRDGIYHWYELEFLEDDGWKVVFRVGDKKLQEAIDLFIKARDFVKANPPKDGND